ncbi:MAG: type II secretion system protein [Ruthenibacterium sp.]
MNKANKRGITLVELICVLAVVAILGAIVGGFMTSAGAQYENAALHTRAKNAIATIQTMLETDLRLADKAVLSTERTTPSPGTKKVFYSNPNNGRIYTSDGKDDHAVDYLSSMPELYKNLMYEIKFGSDKGSLVTTLTAYSIKDGKFDKKIHAATWTMSFLNTTLESSGADSVALWYMPAT